MTTSGPEPSIDHVLSALSSQAGDVHLWVTPDLVCLWSSDGSVRPGVALADAFAAEDAGAVSALLSTAPTGPAWARLRSADASPRWVDVLAAPHDDGGWVLQLRASRQLDPTAAGSSLSVGAGTAEREHVLNEVAWLLSATPRTGKEIAVACCDLDDFAVVNETTVARPATRSCASSPGASPTPCARVTWSPGSRAIGSSSSCAASTTSAVPSAWPTRSGRPSRTRSSLPIGEIVQTVSVGVTLISRGESVDSVLERAEGAMAMAKEAGRNTRHVQSADLSRAAPNRECGPRRTVRA